MQLICSQLPRICWPPISCAKYAITLDRSKQKKAIKELVKAGKVPKELDLKVDLKKVNWPVG